MNEISRDAAGVDLGRWMGRREAFAAVAAKCTAAEAESLYRIRKEKLYLQLEPNWEDFCVKRVGVSRRHIDRFLSPREEFGPAYYLMAQIAHVTPDEFRLIAPHVSEEGLRFDGGVIAFLPENSEKVANAAAVLLEQEKPTKEKAALSFAAMVKRCDALTEAVERMARELEPVEQMKLTISISRLRRAAARKGANTL